MPKSQCPKIKGVIRNVLINADDIWKEVPRVMDKNDVVQVRCTLTCKPLAFQFSLNLSHHIKTKLICQFKKLLHFCIRVHALINLLIAIATIQK